MDNADPGLEGCAKPVYYPVRRPDAAAVEKFRLHKIRDTLKAGLREYDFRALKAIYFGVRCDRRLIRLAMRLLRGRGLKYYLMQLVENSYRLEAIEIENEFPNAKPYRERLAPVDDGIPSLDEKTTPFERELRVAIEMARREPYCERVVYADLSESKGTPENPVFYVTCDRSDGLLKNIYYSLQEIRGHALYA